MPRNKFLIFLFLVAPVAFAQVDRRVLREKRKAPAFDLLKESETLAVIKEQTVQKTEPESRHVYGISVGQLTSQSVTLTSNGYTTNYDMTKPAALFAGKLGYYPIHWAAGYWGLMGGIGYSQREKVTPSVSSALHLFAADLLISYRLEPSSRSWIKPYAGVGGGTNVVLQRGFDQLNTSEAHGVIVSVIGAGFNLNRLFSMTSVIDYEPDLQWKHWTDPKPSNLNFGGNILSVGMGIAL